MSDRDRDEGRGSDKKPNFQIKLERVRLSYPKIWHAEAFRGGRRGSSEGTGEKSFSATALIDKDNKAHQELYEMIRDTIDDAMDDKWGKNKPRLKPDKYCLQDGDAEDDPADGYAGHWFLRARNKSRPKIMDVDGVTPLVEDDGRPYGGCIVNMWVRIWAQDNDYGTRVNATLEAIQFIKDGEAFGAAPISDDEFKDEREDGDRRSSRRGRDDDDRGGRDRDRNRDRDSDSRSSRDRDSDRSERRGRDDDDRRGSRDRDRDDDRRGSRDRDRDRDRDDDDRRGSRDRDRDSDRGSDRGSRDRDRDEDRGSRDRDSDDRGSRRRSY